MQILIQNAGAQSGHLILENSGEWLLKLLNSLMGMVRMPVARVLQSIPMANQLPESIIQYVIRTQESDFK